MLGLPRLLQMHDSLKFNMLQLHLYPSQIFTAVMLYRSQGSVVSTTTRLLAEWYRVQVPVWAGKFSLLQNVQTLWVPHTALYSVGTEVLPWG
jgi:hypothetical protein